MQVCSMLTEARKSVGITQEQLAKRLGVSVGTVCNWESDPTRISIEKVKRYYAALPELESRAVSEFFAAL